VLGSPLFRSYYLCRGVDPSAIVEELLPLTDEVMLVADSRAEEVIADLREYATSRELAGPGCGEAIGTLGATFRLVVDIVLIVVEQIFNLLYLAAYAAALALVLSIWVDAIVPYRSWLAALCGVGWGTVLSRIETLDLWPWFGRAIRLRRDDLDVVRVLHRYRLARVSAVVAQVVYGLLFVVPVAAVMRGTPLAAAGWLALGVAAGIGNAILGRWLARRVLVMAAEQKGLRPAAMATRARTAAVFDVLPMYWRAEEAAFFDSEEAEIVRRWLAMNALTAAFYRPFLTQPDYVFISYVWADDAAIRTARALSDTLTSLGIPHFLDRRHLVNGFVGWRSHVARELERATHLFVVVSPQFTTGRVVQRELRTAILRWHSEQLPAIFCVADEGAAETLVRNAAAPLELRFVLAACPRLSPAEVTDPDLVRRVVAQRRRQGRVRDWLAVLRPRRTEEALLARMMW
jgi:hypothetical protein